jgi:hypothetical protein
MKYLISYWLRRTTKDSISTASAVVAEPLESGETQMAKTLRAREMSQPAKAEEPEATLQVTEQHENVLEVRRPESAAEPAVEEDGAILQAKLRAELETELSLVESDLQRLSSRRAEIRRELRVPSAGGGGGQRRVELRYLVRGHQISHDWVIEVLVDNPKKPQTGTWHRWERGYPKKGGSATVKEILATGITAGDLRYDLEHGFTRCEQAKFA